MGRISKTFSELEKQKKKALIAYIVAGDPDLSCTLKSMHLMVSEGVNIIELGVAFSDPMAEGPSIQRGHERALIEKTSLEDILKLVMCFRETNKNTPVVLMGYMNPFRAMGCKIFSCEASQSGVDGLLIVDMPPEEADEFGPLLKARGLAAIFLVAPTTSHARAATICAHGEGYLYYVSLKGVTGAATLNAEDVAEHLAPLRDMTDLPLCVGFGIRDGVTAAEVAKVADGVIVGSALVNRIADSVDAPETIAGQLKSVLAEMRTAMDA